MEKLFVYGSLHEPEVQIRLVGRTIESKPDSLKGYERDFSLLPPYPVALPAEKSIIQGHILEITSEELAQFDIYETEAYDRIRVTLESGTETWVYVGNLDWFRQNGSA